MRTALIASPLLALLSLSAPALASDRYCKHEAPRQLTLDIGDAKTVVFEVGPHDLTVESRAGAPAAMDGRACSSHADRLARLKIEQRRAGDKLIVRMYEEGSFSGLSFGSNYAYMNLTATLPDHLPVQVKVGSGEAEVTGRRCSAPMSAPATPWAATSADSPPPRWARAISISRVPAA